MSRKTATPAAPDAADQAGGPPGLRAGEAAPLPALPRQRRPKMWLLGVFLVGLGALAGAAYSLSTQERTPVVVMARDVPVGARVSAADLRSAAVAVESGVEVVPAGRMSRVTGSFAAVPLRAGTVLAASQLTSGVAPGQGQQVVPVALQPSQLPARELRPGDRVVVAATPGAPATGGAAAGTAPVLEETVPAVVDRVGSPDPQGTVVVDLVVDADQGVVVAQQASTGRIAVVIISRRR